MSRLPAVSLALAGASWVGSLALAADMPLKAPLPAAAAANWSGWYLGGHAGYLWGRTSVWDDGVLSEKDVPTNGFVGGGLAGANWQNGSWVLGIEGDFGCTTAHGTGIIITPPPDNNTPPPGPPPPTNNTGITTNPPANSYDFNCVGHIRGRLGYAINNVLWFIAGGTALADFDYTQISAVTGSLYSGWTFGGGADVAITRNLIARIEYLHDDFGSKTYFISGDPYRVKLTGDTVRGALMYKF